MALVLLDRVMTSFCRLSVTMSLLGQFGAVLNVKFLPASVICVCWITVF